MLQKTINQKHKDMVLSKIQKGLIFNLESHFEDLASMDDKQTNDLVEAMYCCFGLYDKEDLTAQAKEIYDDLNPHINPSSMESPIYFFDQDSFLQSTPGYFLNSDWNIRDRDGYILTQDDVEYLTACALTKIFGGMDDQFGKITPLLYTLRLLYNIEENKCEKVDNDNSFHQELDKVNELHEPVDEQQLSQDFELLNFVGQQNDDFDLIILI